MHLVGLEPCRRHSDGGGGSQELYKFTKKCSSSFQTPNHMMKFNLNVTSLFLTTTITSHEDDDRLNGNDNDEATTIADDNTRDERGLETHLHLKPQVCFLFIFFLLYY